MSIYSNEFLAIYMDFLEFAHILWKASKLSIVLTDNNSVTRFFPDESYSTVFLERMRLCAAVRF